MGFARVAVKHGCTIIPVINVGTEDMVEVRGEDVNMLFIGVNRLFSGMGSVVEEVRGEEGEERERGEEGGEGRGRKGRKGVERRERKERTKETLRECKVVNDLAENEGREKVEDMCISAVLMLACTLFFLSFSFLLSIYSIGCCRPAPVLGTRPISLRVRSYPTHYEGK